MMCSCLHTRTAHEHYRAGTECSACGCPRYRRPPRARAADLVFAARIALGLWRTMPRRPTR